jgi:exosortase
MTGSDSRIFWKPFAMAGVLGFLYATVITKLATDWWTDQNYSYGLLVPFIVAYILWTEREGLRRELKRPSATLGWAAISCALLALWAGIAGAELYLQRLSLVLMLAGIVLYFWGLPLLRLTLVPLALLLLAMPIPTIIFNQIAFPLQLFASRCAVAAMTFLNIPVLRQGNVIELLPRGAREIKRLEVVEACSGIRSLMTLVTLAAVFAYLSRPGRSTPAGHNKSGTGFLGSLGAYKFWRSIILIVAAIPIAILTNAFRVSGTGVLAHYYGAAVADGFFHSLSGWVMYVLAFLLLLIVAWLLDRMGGVWGGVSGIGRRAPMTPIPAQFEGSTELKSGTADTGNIGSPKGAEQP